MYITISRSRTTLSQELPTVSILLSLLLLIPGLPTTQRPSWAPSRPRPRLLYRSAGRCLMLLRTLLTLPSTTVTASEAFNIITSVTGKLVVMAPMERMSHDELEQQLKDIIQDLYQVMVQVTTYDATGRPSCDVLAAEIKTLSQSLERVHASTSSPHKTLPSVPPELIEYVENGRNPDIYTREFVELVRRGNQLMRGKLLAFADARDVLATEIASAMPELREDVATVLDADATPPVGTARQSTATDSRVLAAANASADDADAGPSIVPTDGN